MVAPTTHREGDLESRLAEDIRAHEQRACFSRIYEELKMRDDSDRVTRNSGLRGDESQSSSRQR